MKRFSPWALTAVTASLALCSAPAWGNVVKESITISGSMGVLGSVPTSQFKAFDPSMGTLVHISVRISGTLDYTGHGIPADEGATLGLADPGRVPDLAFDWFPKVGAGLKFSFDKPDITDAAVLSDYTGTGLRHLEVNDVGGNDSDHYTLAGSGTVTFEYVAAPSSPPVYTWYGSSVVLSVIMAGPVTPPPGSPVEAQLGFLDLNGTLIGQLTPVTLLPGQVASVSLNANQVVHAAGQLAGVQPVILFPPSGFVPGIYASTEVSDAQTGIGKVLTIATGDPTEPASLLGPQGVAGGQLLRLAVSAFAPNPCVATLGFADHFGNPVGPSIPVDLSPGHAQALDLDASVLGLQSGQRAEVQPIVTLHTPVNTSASSSGCSVSSQAIDKTSGQTGTYQALVMQQ
ncbi:MAG TPA: hypothetical protein VN841_01640 [Bryobacteraceae bacterium]|nr:hypothetical protein [Bryobacteraceae bacterium]